MLSLKTFRSGLPILIIGLFTGILSAQHNSNLVSAVSGSRVRPTPVHSQPLALQDALSVFEQEFGVGFLYYSGVGREVKVKNLPALTGQDLQSMLARVLAPLNLVALKVGEGSYVVARASEQNAVAAAFGVPQPQEGGTLTGRVTEAETGDPLAFSQVVIVGSTYGDVADAEGRYEIKNVPPGTYEVEASFIGYRKEKATVSVGAGATVTQDFALVTDVLGLETVVTTATRVGRTQKEATTSMAVISAKRIERMQPQSVAEVLRTVPGIYAEEGGGEVAVNSFVRGLPAPGQFRYQTLQENGIPVRSLPGGFISAEDVFFRQDLNIRTLEVAKGGASTLFGINAPGGIINYLDKTGGSVMQSTLRFTAGEKDYYRTDFNTNGPLGDRYYFNIGGFYRFD
ncbi:MAG: hypothetical protein D6743_17375, partial [Calditrichaeota bacterium]